MSYQVKLLLLLALVLLLIPGCTGSRLITEVSVQDSVITPNGTGVGGTTTINYALSREARLTASLLDANGNEYVLRKEEPRSAGSYSVKFTGSYPASDGKADQRVLPDGTYTFVIKAVDENGRQDEQRGQITIQGADTKAPEVADVVVLPQAISPNGDSKDDETTISYRLTKESMVNLFVSDDRSGRRYLLEAPNKKPASLQSHRWNGTSGGKLLPDGKYTFHIQAEDKAGNITDYTSPIEVEGGGTPRLEVLSARFFPTAVPVGGAINVEVKVKNTGDAVLHSLGPDPGTPYDTVENFLKFTDKTGEPLYYERPGFWRIGVDWDQSARPYPVRWGLVNGDGTVSPGQEATITGSIKVTIRNVRQVHFWVTAIQEGVGYGGRMGITTINVSY